MNQDDQSKPAEIINLRRRRKAAARGKAEKQAEQNRLTFGLSKQQRSKAQMEEAAKIRFVDGHKRQLATSDANDEAARPASRDSDEPASE